MALSLLHLAALALAAALPASASDLITNEDVRLVPTGLLGGDGAGAAVHLDGDTLVVGAHTHPAAGFSAGAVFVYRNIAGIWTEEATLVGSHTSAGDRFGVALEVQGDRLVVGAGWKEINGQGQKGEAYVFERLGNTWQQTARLLPSNISAGIYFGVDVALDGDVIVVGAHGANSFQGGAYVFELVGGLWTETTVLSPSHGGPHQLFGDSVDIYGSTIAVGAPGTNLSSPFSSDGPGAAYVFRRVGASPWFEEAALSGNYVSDIWPAPLSMGDSIAIDGDTLVVGAPHSSGGRGTSFVFEHSFGTWTQTAQLSSTFPEARWSGQQVDVDGDLIVTGAPLTTPHGSDLQLGTVTVWQRETSGWSERRELLANTMVGEGQMGYGVAIEGRRVVAGAQYEPTTNSYGGAVYTFTLPNSVGDTFCFGDGQGTPCACDWNNITPGSAGCLNSGIAGAFLVGVGTASVGADDLSLVAGNLLPGTPALLFRGTTELNGGNGSVLGAGLLCLGGNIQRLAVVLPNAAGYASWGPGLANSEGFVSGDTPHFQVWYRDPEHICAPFNLSNGYRVMLQP